MRRPRASRPPPAPAVAATRLRRGQIVEGETALVDMDTLFSDGETFYGAASAVAALFCPAPSAGVRKKSVPPTLQHRRRSSSQQQSASVG